MSAIILDADRCALFNADVFDALKTVPDASIDSNITDPPYELGFMGKTWDATGIAYSVGMWREVLRVLKPGGHLLAFGGTRTYHRMTCAIEDAGFEVRDSLHWFYGTGFPKSLNCGEGRGTALKPAHEPIVLARKPLIGTVAANLAAHGTGALNIDASRLLTSDPLGGGAYSGGARPSSTGPMLAQMGRLDPSEFVKPVGRWPANVLLDEDSASELDAQSGFSTSTGKTGRRGSGFGGFSRLASNGRTIDCPSDSGGASRFFYVSKPGRKERDAGCEALPMRSGGEATDRADDSVGVLNPRAGAGRGGGARNVHPTVKPVDLMRYLVRLVTPPRGVVLDPFAGSGTTGVAALLEGRRFVGVEKSAEYLPITLARLNHALRGDARAGQLPMFEGTR